MNVCHYIPENKTRRIQIQTFAVVFFFMVMDFYYLYGFFTVFGVFQISCLY